MPELQHHATPPHSLKIYTFLTHMALTFGVILCLFVLTACPQDQTALQSEAIQLKKRTAKLESVIQSLQEGNKVLQQHINRLNQDARETEASYESNLQKAHNQITHLANSPKKSVATIHALEQKNNKLQRDAKWLRSQRDHMRQSLVIQQIGGQTYELPFPFTTVSTIMEAAFTKNGYTILTTMQSDQKAIYITDRKTSLPSSLELSGFRNQYLSMIKKGPADHTTIWVRAEFEKLSRKGHIFAAPQAELADIEMRLIQEIHQTLVSGNAAKKRKF